MSEAGKKSGGLIAIVTMFALYGMVGFVTNLAAPIGKVWMLKPGIDGSASMAMLGNLMNFVPYLIMGIPAGKMLIRLGYKATALVAIATGLVGVFVQFLSGQVLAGSLWGGVPAPFFVYLLGAFICGFCVCMLNTVVNPMLNTIGGGGKRGNQLNMGGSSVNSLCCTVAPILVGMMAGEVSKDTQISSLNGLLFTAMAIFAFAFVVIACLKIENPSATSANVVYERSPLAFRHCLLGVVGILAYMGVEVGIPNIMNLWLSADSSSAIARQLIRDNPGMTAAAVSGAVAGTYWFLMLIGRIVGALIGGRVTSKAMLTCCSAGAILLIALGICSQSVVTAMPVFTGKSFMVVKVPLTALLFALCGLCTSVMWAGVFNLAVEGLGKYTEKASGIFMTMVVGGGVLPLLQAKIASSCGYMVSYWVPGICLAYMFLYAVFFSKNVNTDIKVD